MSISKQVFGKTDHRESVDLYTLTNHQGMTAKITNYGGTIVSLETPDRDGRLGDVVLGFDNLGDYIEKSPYFGCLVGRFANRIANGKFTLGSVDYTLAQNDGPNSLHGGLQGFDKRIWLAESFEAPNGPGLILRYQSLNAEEGYPGNLNIQVTYMLTNDNELRVAYAASTDQTTVVNLTNHSYFNLAVAGDVLNHELTIHASNYTPVDESLIPTGKLQAVKNTPFDFTCATTIGSRIHAEDEQLKIGGGFDHNYVLDRADDEMVHAAEVYEPVSGRLLSVYTTQPGVQFYSGNFLDGSITGKKNRVYHRRSGFCLETQHYPDSPNQSDFPSTVLEPGEKYSQQTIFAFTTR
jgi:aldose 1-epimerase